MQKQPITYLEYLKNPTLIAIVIALLTTGFLRLQLLTGNPETDGGIYTFASQYFYHALVNGEIIQGPPLFFYQLITAWVYGLDVNQFILLRAIDGLVAVTASIVLFKVILKESDSTLFTLLFMVPLLIVMNDLEVVMYGFRNSIWAAYLPLFSAILIWQNSTKKDKYSFYLIGGLVSLGVLLREPFLPFFLLVGIAIFIGYGWRVLFKYLIGSAVVGFSILGFLLMLRGWDLIDLFESYISLSLGIDGLKWTFPLAMLELNWFIFLAGIISIAYIVKLYLSDKKLVNMRRFYLWVLIALLPILEIISKESYIYHYANLLPGLVGLTALSWKYMSNQESKKIKVIAFMLIGVMSLLITLPKINSYLGKDSFIIKPSYVMSFAPRNSFRYKAMIENSQYLITAKEIYELSRTDSTLASTGMMQALFPLTGLLPPTYQFCDLYTIFKYYDFDEGKLIELFLQHRPTLIITPGNIKRSRKDDARYEQSLHRVIEKTNLYDKIKTILGSDTVHYGWLFEKPGIIYRLKDFK